MDRDSRIRVTVVHQNRIFQQCLAQVLVDQGDYNVFQADHASPDCRRAIAAGNPHVLLIDLNLPDQLALELTGPTFTTKLPGLTSFCSPTARRKRTLWSAS